MLIVLIVGGLIGYYISQSRIPTTDQQGAVITSNPMPPTETDKKVIQALNAATYKTEKDFHSGIPINKSLNSFGISTTDMLINYAWCTGNRLFIQVGNQWYYWAESQGSWIPNGPPFGIGYGCVYGTASVV